MSQLFDYLYCFKTNLKFIMSYFTQLWIFRKKILIVFLMVFVHSCVLDTHEEENFEVDSLQTPKDIELRSNTF